MTALERYIASKRPQPKCPYCDRLLTDDDNYIREDKHILSSVPIHEDSRSTTYFQRSVAYKYRCCKKCNEAQELMSSSNKLLYYIGTALIGIGFFVHVTILLIGVASIFCAILMPFLISKIYKIKYGATYERVRESGAIIE